MTRGVEIARRIGAARASRKAGELAEAARTLLPGASVWRNGDTVTITARGALSRLRWPGGLLR